MRHNLAADLLEVKWALKDRQLISSTVPFWSFQSTGPLLVTGKALQTAEEVSILSLVVLIDISSTSITAGPNTSRTHGRRWNRFPLPSYSPYPPHMCHLPRTLT